MTERRWGLSRDGVERICAILGGLGTAIAEVSPGMAAGVGIGATALGGAAVALPLLATAGGIVTWQQVVREGREDACAELFTRVAGELVGEGDPTSRYEGYGRAALEEALVAALVASLPRQDEARLRLLAGTGLSGAAVAAALHGAVPPGSRFAEGAEADLFREAVAGTWEHLRRDADFYRSLHSYVDEEKLRLLAGIKADTTAIRAGMDDLVAETRMLARALGAQETRALMIAERYAPGAHTTHEDAMRGIEAALRLSVEREAAGVALSNAGAEVTEILTHIRAMTGEGDLSGARRALRDALAANEDRRAREEAAQAALLEEGMVLARYDNDPDGAVEYAVARLDLEGAADGFAALRKVQDEWYGRGRDKGLRFDLEVGIALARTALDRASDADARGAAGNDLGTALAVLGERETGTARLEEAVDAYRAALLHRDRKRAPLDWAKTQDNLGSALRSLAEREEGTGRLDQAVTAYRAALEERTRNRVPFNWAGTQTNLGATFLSIGERRDDAASLRDAITACRAALEVYAGGREPYNRAITENNLGAALQALGSRERDAGLLHEAIEAYLAALQEWRRDRTPVYWALAQVNLSETKRSMAIVTEEGATALLAEAREHARDALAVFEEAGASHYAALARRELARIETGIRAG